MKKLFESPMGNYYLSNNQSLSQDIQPWNAADDYLLNFTKNNLHTNSEQIVIFNDDFGALSVVLSNLRPVTITDSYKTRLSIDENLKLNSLPPAIICNPGENDLTHKLVKADIILVKIPKSIDYLLYFLELIKPFIKPETKVFASGMVKHISDNLAEIMKENFGNTLIHKVIKKAILFEIKFEKLQRQNKFTDYKSYSTENGLMIYNYPNVFSMGKIDNGTRLLLKNVYNNLEGKILDLGSGCGIIALQAALNNNKAEIFATDESFLAVQSTEITLSKNNISGKIIQADGVEQFKDNYFTAVISNPPFHCNCTLSHDETRRLFLPIWNKLIENGKFLMVCNKSISYRIHLLKIFSKVTEIDRNEKYIILEAIK